MSIHASNAITNTWTNPYLSFVQVPLFSVCLNKKGIHWWCACCLGDKSWECSNSPLQTSEKCYRVNGMRSVFLTVRWGCERSSCASVDLQKGGVNFWRLFLIYIYKTSLRGVFSKVGVPVVLLLLLMLHLLWTGGTARTAGASWCGQRVRWVPAGAGLYPGVSCCNVVCTGDGLLGITRNTD